MQPPDDDRFRTYRPDERPDVLVLLDDGDEVERRAWKLGPDGWVGSMQWRRGPGQGTRTGDFPVDRIREDDRDFTPPGWTPSVSPPSRLRVDRLP